MVQDGAPILREPARAFDLPADRESAEEVVDRLLAATEQIAQVHPFTKGMGIAAPQIGIGAGCAGGTRSPTRLLEPA